MLCKQQAYITLYCIGGATALPPRAADWARCQTSKGNSLHIKGKHYDLVDKVFLIIGITQALKSFWLHRYNALLVDK